MPTQPKPLRHQTDNELMRYPESRSHLAAARTRKYSVWLLEEMYRLYKRTGSIAKAAKQAGVNYNSAKHYILVSKKLAGEKLGANRSEKVSPAVKQKVYELAHKLKRSGFARGMRDCWIAAGGAYGVSGRTVEFQYVRGIWSPEKRVKEAA